MNLHILLFFPFSSLYVLVVSFNTVLDIPDTSADWIESDFKEDGIMYRLSVLINNCNFSWMNQ